MRRRLTSLPLSLVVFFATPALAQEAQPAQEEPAAADDSAAVEDEANSDAITAEPAPDESAEVPVAPAPEGGVPADYDPEAADDRPVFLVTDIVVEDGVGISADAARDALAARFGRLRDKLDVRSLGEVKATLDQQALNQLLGGEGDGLEKLGSYVDADRVVFGRIHRVGDVTEVSVRVFHVEEATMEMAMSRRLKADAPESLVLTVLDSLADRLTVWALNTYGDAAPSAKFAELKQKKVRKRSADVVEASDSPWTFMGVGGSALATAGLGAVAVGATMVAASPEPDVVAATVVMAAGAATFAGGMALVVVDGLE